MIYERHDAGFRRLLGFQHHGVVDSLLRLLPLVIRKWLLSFPKAVVLHPITVKRASSANFLVLVGGEGAGWWSKFEWAYSPAMRERVVVTA